MVIYPLSLLGGHSRILSIASLWLRPHSPMSTIMFFVCVMIWAKNGISLLLKFQPVVSFVIEFPQNVKPSGLGTLGQLKGQLGQLQGQLRTG